MNKNRVLRFANIQMKIIYLLFFSQFFFIISLGNIGSLPLTIPFLVSTLFIIFSVFGFFIGEIKISLNRLIIFIFLFVACFFSFLLNRYNHNIKSLFMYLYYFLIYLLIDNRNTGDGFKNISKKFVIITMIFSIYGLYQFVAYNIIDLPFKELIPRRLMVNGYNIIQSKDNIIDGITIVKAHSLYSEASTLSRYSAIGIILAIYYSKDIKKFLLVSSLFFNLISIVISFSGSGLIFLICGAAFLLIYLNKKSKINILLLFAAGAVFCFTIPTMRNFLLLRIGEFFSPNTSAYYRFVLPFKIGFDSIFTDFLGYGVGNDEIAIAAYGGLETGIANGFGKIFVECGIIGLIVFALLLLSVKNKNKNVDFNLYYLIMILMCVSSTFLDPTIWSFICLLIINNKREGEIAYERKSSFAYDKLL